MGWNDRHGDGAYTSTNGSTTTTGYEHPGYGAGAGSVERSESPCPCGKGLVVEERDDIPGFRSRDTFLKCEICQAAELAIVWERSGAAGLDDMRTSKPSYPYIGQWVIQHADRVEYVNSHMVLLRDTEAVASAALVLAGIDAEAELEFFTALAEGGLPEDNPITVLGGQLAERRRSMFDTDEKGRRRYITNVDQLGMIFQAWNAWRNGEAVTKLNTAPARDSFPVPV